MESNQRVKRKYRRKKKESRTEAATYSKGLWIVEQYKKGYTLKQIGEAMGVTRQRVYTLAKKTGLAPSISKLFRKRFYERDILSVQTRLRKCRWCGKKYILIRGKTRSFYCNSRHARKMKNYFSRIRYHSRVR